MKNDLTKEIKKTSTFTCSNEGSLRAMSPREEELNKQKQVAELNKMCQDIQRCFNTIPTNIQKLIGITEVLRDNIIQEHWWSKEICPFSPNFFLMELMKIKCQSDDNIQEVLEFMFIRREDKVESFLEFLVHPKLLEESGDLACNFMTKRFNKNTLALALGFTIELRDMLLFLEREGLVDTFQNPVGINDIKADFHL